MVAVADVVGDPPVTRFPSSLHQVVAAGDAHEQQHRHAATGHGEVVGAVEQAVFWQIFRCDYPILGGGNPLEIVLQFTLALAYQDYVTGQAGGLQDIEGEVGHRGCQRIDGIVGVGFGSQQTTFLCGPQGKNHAAWQGWAGLENTGQLQYAGGSERIVIGARAHGATLGIRRALTIGIPVRRGHEDFIGVGRARQYAEHVLAVDFPDRDLKICAETGVLKIKGLKVGVARGHPQLFQVVAGSGQQARCGFPVNPALQGHRLCVGVCKGVVFAG